MNNGYIKLFRKINEWEWYQDSNTFRLFIHCLIKANHKDKKWQGILIKRGEFLTSSLILAKELGITRQQIRTSIKKLISTNEITSKSTNKNTVITVLNYENYQGIESQSTSNITINQPADNQQVTTTKNDKNDKNEKNNKNLQKVFEDLKGAYLYFVKKYNLTLNTSILELSQKKYQTNYNNFKKFVNSRTEEEQVEYINMWLAYVAYKNTWYSECDTRFNFWKMFQRNFIQKWETDVSPVMEHIKK